ncbi:hypothetical protein L083_2580 [Actinoplanes sp. N902-109]|nr:hypothetical protein L083_2580 [Actinoplanes sp. N902-109]
MAFPGEDGYGVGDFVQVGFDVGEGRLLCLLRRLCPANVRATAMPKLRSAQVSFD